MKTPNQIIYLLKNEPLSQRLIRALAALEKAEQPKSVVKPDMNIFHNEYSNSKCFACLGGLAALDLCGLPDRKVVNVGSWGELAELAGLGTEEGGMLVGVYENTLDDLRTGDIQWALERYCTYADAPIEANIDSIEVANYHQDPAQFKLDMQAIITLLQSHGL